MKDGKLVGVDLFSGAGGLSEGLKNSGFDVRLAVDSDYYSTKAKQWSDEAKRKPPGSGGDYYATKRAYLGERYLDVAFGKFYRNQISVDQLADYIGVKSKNISAMEHSLFNRVGAL